MYRIQFTAPTTTAVVVAFTRVRHSASVLCFFMLLPPSRRVVDRLAQFRHHGTDMYVMEYAKNLFIMFFGEVQVKMLTSIK